jgi:predicted dehydrogenase
MGAAGMAAPLFARQLRAAASTPVLRHASFGSAGMAWADIQSICGNDFVKLVAIAEVDLNRIQDAKARFPEARIYQDWRELLDKEHQNIDSVNVSAPDHMHGPMAMAAMQLGKHVYCQKPLAHNLHETRQLTKVARERGLVTQMGIQVHSSKFYRQAVALVQSGAIGSIKEAHLWSAKKWGDLGQPPVSSDPIPAGFDWNLWQGGCASRPFVGGEYYHPGNWRKRLDFGTGTFGDMGCHIFDPVFEALALTAPISVRSDGAAPDQWNWATDATIRYVFPGNHLTAGATLAVTWYDGDVRPPADVQALVLEDGAAQANSRGPRGLPEEGSIIIGTKGTLLLPHVSAPRLYPVAQFKDYPMPEAKTVHHWTEWAEACVGIGKPSANFDYAGPLTETVLLGSVAVRFPKFTLQWNSDKLQFENLNEANEFVRRRYRHGWEIDGL